MRLIPVRHGRRPTIAIEASRFVIRQAFALVCQRWTDVTLSDQVRRLTSRVEARRTCQLQLFDAAAVSSLAEHLPRRAYFRLRVKAMACLCQSSTNSTTKRTSRAVEVARTASVRRPGWFRYSFVFREVIERFRASWM